MVELPTAVAAMAAGQLTLEQVLPIANHVPADFEESVVELAHHATVPQIIRATSSYPFPAPEPITETSPDLESAACDESQPESEETPSDPTLGASATHPLDRPETRPAWLSMGYDHAGRFRLRYDAPAEVGALVEAAIREATESLWNQSQADPTDTASGTTTISYADGLAHLATARLTSLESSSRQDAYRIYVHLDTEGGWLTGKPRLPGHILEKVTCDGTLQPVWLTEGIPVNVGRARRIVSPHIRRLVHDRDRGCRYPGCGATRYVEVHHIRHWLHGGESNYDGLALLCGRHHDALHRGDYTISGNPNLPEPDPTTPRAADPLTEGLRFTARAGWAISYQSPPGTASAGWRAPDGLAQRRADRPGSPGASGTTETATYAGPSGEILHTHWVSFDRRTPSTSPRRKGNDNEGDG